MAKSKDFESFLKDINPSDSTIAEASRLHTNLRDHLKDSETYADVYENSYLSGSYAKHTFVRPKKESDDCDIDVIVETRSSISDMPYDVLQKLEKAIRERSCYQNVRIQNHSVGIEMANFHLDVVPLVKDQGGLLYIGSSDDGNWVRTEPKQHISWSADANRDFDENYKPLVKILKWWRRENCPTGVKFPKGITLEKMIADNLPDTGLPIEERVMQTMANLASAYSEELDSRRVPFIEDPALPENNLASSYSLDDFEQFVSKLNEHLDLLAVEGTDNSIWKKILGDNFPSGSAPSTTMSLAKAIGQKYALSVKHKQAPYFPIQPSKPNAIVTATVTLPSGFSYELENDGPAIPKESIIIYKVTCSPVMGGVFKWQVTNTGEEAMNVCPRGGFEKPNEGKTKRRESTAYTGKHFVQCFVLHNGNCVRWSQPFFINVE